MPRAPAAGSPVKADHLGPGRRPGRHVGAPAPQALVPPGPRCRGRRRATKPGASTATRGRTEAVVGLGHRAHVAGNNTWAPRWGGPAGGPDRDEAGDRGAPPPGQRFDGTPAGSSATGPGGRLVVLAASTTRPSLFRVSTTLATVRRLGGQVGGRPGDGVRHPVLVPAHLVRLSAADVGRHLLAVGEVRRGVVVGRGPEASICRSRFEALLPVGRDVVVVAKHSAEALLVEPGLQIPTCTPLRTVHGTSSSAAPQRQARGPWRVAPCGTPRAAPHPQVRGRARPGR